MTSPSIYNYFYQKIKKLQISKMMLKAKYIQYSLHKLMQEFQKITKN